MSQVNIIIVVDVDILLEQTNSLSGNPIVIKQPENCIYMHDDYSYASYLKEKGRAELISFVSGGDLLTWTILANKPSLMGRISLISIDDKTNYENIDTEAYLFSNNNKPIIFCKNKRACIAISDDIRVSPPKKDYYQYTVTFKFDKKEYSWDPFVEATGGN